MNKYERLIKKSGNFAYILSAAFMIAALLVNAVPLAPAFAGGSGSIWTTTSSCGEDPVNANEYSVGDVVYINGANFDPGTYDWSVDEVSGVPIDGSTGSVTPESDGTFCFAAYTILSGESGVYRADVDGKKDQYHVGDDPVDVCSNIEGIQLVIPEGLILVNGECVAPEPTPTEPTPTEPTPTEPTPTEPTPTEPTPTEPTPTEPTPTEPTPTETTPTPPTETPPPPVTPSCADPAALNYEGPVPCRYAPIIPVTGGQVLIPVTGMDFGSGRFGSQSLFLASVAFFGLGLVLSGVARKREE